MGSGAVKSTMAFSQSYYSRKAESERAFQSSRYQTRLSKLEKIF